MASYAPLMAQKDAWQWTPDLIWFDNLSVVRTPDYYVQELFARNRGDEELACDLSDLTASQARRFYVAAARDTGHHQLILKIVNATDQVIPAMIRSDRHPDLQLLSSIGLRGDGPNAENNFVHPHDVEPRPLAEPVGNGGAVPVPAHSLVVLRLALEGS
jgi:alpha-N-arabinofuranosidase